MRAIEQAAFDSGAVTGLELMERAGAGTVAALFEAWPELGEGERRAVVLCGPGNNGGDGYVVACLLHGRGWQVEVRAMGDPEKMPPDARANRDRWAALGPVFPLDGADEGARPDVLVDALFGTGLSRPIPEEAERALAGVLRRPGKGGRCRVLAVDAPSGLDCDTGRLLRAALPEDAPAEEPDGSAWHPGARAVPVLTVTYHKAKLGQYLGDGPVACGRLVLHDIGIGAWDRAEAPPPRLPAPERVRLLGGDRDGGQAPPWPARQIAAFAPARHKYHRGHVVVLAGGPGRGGAGRLAARAALRVGAGLVTVACPPAALQENAARLDAIMLRPVADADALDALLTDPRLSSVVLGPGLGSSERTRALVATACRPAETGASPRKVVLDADALTSFADAPEALFEHLHEMCVLTPHEGEFARIFPDLAARERPGLRLSKVDAARRAADRAGCTILLKGPDTVVASPGGAASLHAAAYDRAAPWLGTAGAGDVLAGLIGGLLAPAAVAGTPHPATEAAVWLHVEAARHVGPGLIAEDLPEALPEVFRALGV
jgi:hydroxyethylthiazole kinase-like uncharacterized protein yjeF